MRAACAFFVFHAYKGYLLEEWVAFEVASAVVVCPPGWRGTFLEVLCVFLDPAIGNLIEDLGLWLRVRKQPARLLLALGESAPGLGGRLLMLGRLSSWFYGRNLALEMVLREVLEGILVLGDDFLGLFGRFLRTASFDHSETVVFRPGLGGRMDLCSASAVFVERKKLPGVLIFLALLGDRLIGLEDLAVLDRVTEFLAVSAMETSDSNALVSLERGAGVRVLVVLVADAAIAAVVAAGVVLGNDESLNGHDLIVQ